jgi:hypothetical protein
VWWSPPEDRIPIGFQIRTGFVSSDPAWQAWLADTIAEGQFAHVIIDTMGTTSGDVDTDRSSDLMNKILRPIRDISSQTGAGVTIVHHNKKGSEGNHRGGQRMLGSVALHAWVNDALYVHTRESLNGGRTKVRLERESKAATEERWIVEIPRMGTTRDGTRVVWTPLVGEWNTSEEPVTGDSDKPDHTPPTTQRRGNGRPAGSDIAWQVKLLAGEGNRFRTLTDIAGSKGCSIRVARQQLEKAVENGLVVGNEETGWRMP